MHNQEKTLTIINKDVSLLHERVTCTLCTNINTAGNFVLFNKFVCFVHNQETLAVINKSVPLSQERVIFIFGIDAEV